MVADEMAMRVYEQVLNVSDHRLGRGSPSRYSLEVPIDYGAAEPFRDQRGIGSTERHRKAETAMDLSKPSEGGLSSRQFRSADTENPERFPVTHRTQGDARMSEDCGSGSGPPRISSKSV